MKQFIFNIKRFVICKGEQDMVCFLKGIYTVSYGMHNPETHGKTKHRKCCFAAWGSDSKTFICFQMNRWLNSGDVPDSRGI